MKRQIVFKRNSISLGPQLLDEEKDNGSNIVCRAFNTGKPQHVRNAYESRELIGDYLQIDAKLHSVTRNIIVMPLKLGRSVVGCIECANKRGTQEFTDQDQEILMMLSEQVASGIISQELKQGMKKEFDEETK